MNKLSKFITNKAIMCVYAYQSVQLCIFRFKKLIAFNAFCSRFVYRRRSQEECYAKNIEMHNSAYAASTLKHFKYTWTLRDFGRNVSYTFGETLTLSRAICIREFASGARFPLRISCETAFFVLRTHSDVSETAK